MRFAKFIVVFVVIYAALIVPWPGLRECYGSWFRGFSSVFLAREGTSIVRFRRAENPPRPVIDSEIVLARSAQPDAKGQVEAKILGLDTRGVGWIPTAWFLGLVAATPVPWRRRLLLAGIGLLAVHAYLVFATAAYLWNESAGVVPFSFLPFCPGIGDFLEETLMTQIGPSFVIPVLIWLALVAGLSPSVLTKVPVDEAVKMRLSPSKEAVRIS